MQAGSACRILERHRYIELRTQTVIAIINSIVECAANANVYMHETRTTEEMVRWWDGEARLHAAHASSM